MNIIVCGRRAEGKSTLSLYLARQASKGVVIFDPRGSFSGSRCSDTEGLMDAIENRDYEKGPIVFTPEINISDGFNSLASVLFGPRFYEVGPFNYALVIDEAGQLQTAHSSHPDLARAIAQHPLECVTIIQNTHRLAELHGQSKALMDDLYIFCTIYPRDVDALFDYAEDQEVIEHVKTLPHHHALHYSYRRCQALSEKQWEVLDKPEMWYSSISAKEVAA